MKSKKISSYGDTVLSDIRALVADQSRDLATKVGDNLYSVYLKRLETGMLGPLYTDWPIKDPIVDKTYYMDEVDEAEDEGEETQESQLDPLINAFNAYFRKQVYKRIHEDGLEPIIDYTPEVGPAGVDLALKVRSILQVVMHSGGRTALENQRRFFWTDLPINNERVKERMQKLFPIVLKKSHDQEACPREARDLKRMVTREERFRARQFMDPRPTVNESEPVMTLQDKLNESLISEGEESGGESEEGIESGSGTGHESDSGTGNESGSGTGHESGSGTGHETDHD